jgi:LysM repeat protein
LSGRQQSESALTCLNHHFVIKEEPPMREELFHQFRGKITNGVKRLRAWFRAQPQAQRRLISGGIGLVVVATLTVVAAMPAITSASEMDALGNGGFEQGFYQVNGCGTVGNHWNCFTNGGAANYGFYDDQWELVVYEGKHSQLIEINTKDMAAGDNDRYAGISQTARVVPGKPYQFSMRGLIRTTNSEGDPWRYSVQVGWLNEPNGDWQDVENWVDVGWNTYYNRTEPGAFSAFQTQLVPKSEVITIFVRVWKKWGVAYEELDVNIDAISLTGPSAQHGKPGPERDGRGDGKGYDGVGGPVPGQEYRPEQFNPQGPQAQGQQGPQAQGPQPQQGKPEEYRPTYRPSEPNHDYPLSCGGPDLVYNGSFEAGFNEVPWGEVGKGWDAFTNGGAANYGFYDEEWDIVVADGNHGQLIEINTKSVYPTDADRYAGIYQRIGGLHPGATYELTLRGELRGEGNEDDPHRFAAQWGLGKDGDWQSVDEWTTMDLGPIQVRTQPVPLAQYKVRFEAPSSNVVLFIRGWKKFAVTNVEMDLNLDAISLRGCDARGPEKKHDDRHEPQYPGTGGPVGQPGNACGSPCGDDHGEYPGGANCLYVVKPGDTLGQIALDFGVSIDAIIRANGIQDASAIYVGQKFEIPGCKGGKPSAKPEARTSDGNEPQAQEWEITQGERPADSPQRGGPAVRPTAQERDVPEQASYRAPEEQAQSERHQTTYVVQPGDMLSWIAEEHNVNAYDLATYNSIDNLNFIYTGQVLVIPN